MVLWVFLQFNPIPFNSNAFWSTLWDSKSYWIEQFYLNLGFLKESVVLRRDVFNVLYSTLLLFSHQWPLLSWALELVSFLGISPMIPSAFTPLETSTPQQRPSLPNFSHSAVHQGNFHPTSYPVSFFFSNHSNLTRALDETRP